MLRWSSRGALRAAAPLFQGASRSRFAAAPAAFRHVTTRSEQPAPSAGPSFLADPDHAHDGADPFQGPPFDLTYDRPHAYRHPATQRKLCSLGTGEVVHILSFEAKDEDHVEPFERVVQRIAFELHDMEAGVSDVRVCHPRCGEAAFVVTVVSSFESAKFEEHIAPRITAALSPFVTQGRAAFNRKGTLMPQAHSLSSLLGFLQANVGGRHHSDHDVAAVRHELAKWFPRREEYERFVHWDPHHPTKYTRNIVFRNEHMECLLMCWPPGARSSIHCHDESSCFVAAVEGEVVEVQYQLPKMDKQFFKREATNPTGAIGRCGPLRATHVSTIGKEGGPSETYANNELGIHSIENRTSEPAITMHVYAPPLQKMKVFRQAPSGDYSIATVATVKYMSDRGEKTGDWGRCTDPDGVIDVKAWNRVDEVVAET
mmetsp:Transcript_19689/g.66186  ORF Transcript_19689/g.66186 Transcript_19689/m.66186 type:complete len:429 (-) Transcript_19689:318-1604(-)